MPKPLLLLTRPRGGNDRFVAALDPELRDKVQVVMAPLLDIVAIEPFPDCGHCDAAIFTSGNGVALAPEGSARPAYCVGRRTADEAARKKWQVVHVAATAEELVQALAGTSPSGRVLHFAGQHRRGEVVERLQALGTDVAACILYDQHERRLSNEAKALIENAHKIIAPIFSPRTAEIFATQVPCRNRIVAVALSPAVASPLSGCGLAHIHICDRPDANQMSEDIENLLRRATFA